MLSQFEFLTHKTAQAVLSVIVAILCVPFVFETKSIVWCEHILLPLPRHPKC